MNIIQGTLQLESVENVARDTKKFRFSVLQQALDFQAGQFVSLQFNETSWRAYSIASTPEEDLIELVVRIIPGGVGSTALDKAQIGDRFNFKGPFGHFVLSDNPDARLIFCGTGTGIAPLRSMILTEKKRNMMLLYGGRNRDDIAYLDEVESWSENLEIKIGLSREEDENKLGKYAKNGRITSYLEELEISNQDEFYICGNGDMVKSVQALLAERGVEKTQIFSERFN